MIFYNVSIKIVVNDYAELSKCKDKYRILTSYNRVWGGIGSTSTALNSTPLVTSLNKDEIMITK